MLKEGKGKETSIHRLIKKKEGSFVKHVIQMSWNFASAAANVKKPLGALYLNVKLCVTPPSPNPN